jgi:hypothetical protein
MLGGSTLPARQSSTDTGEHPDQAVALARTSGYGRALFGDRDAAVTGLATVNASGYYGA